MNSSRFRLLMSITASTLLVICSHVIGQEKIIEDDVNRERELLQVEDDLRASAVMAILKHHDFETAKKNLRELKESYLRNNAVWKVKEAERLLVAIQEMSESTESKKHQQSQAFQQFYEGYAQYVRAEYEQAFHRLLASHSLFQNSFNEVQIEEIECLVYLALICNDAGRHKSARTLIDLALSKSKQVLGDTHPKHASYASILAQFLIQEGANSDAEKLLEQALLVRSQCTGRYITDYQMALTNLARLHLNQGNHKAAGKLLVRYIESEPDKYNEASVLLASRHLLQTSRYMYAIGAYMQAIDYVDRVDVAFQKSPQVFGVNEHLSMLQYYEYCLIRANQSHRLPEIRKRAEVFRKYQESLAAALPDVQIKSNRDSN